MARPGQDAGRSPETAALAGGSGPDLQGPSFDQKMAVRLTELGLLSRMLRSRRFYERLAMAGIVLAALRGLGQENSASTMARLSAWNKREVQRLEHKVERVERKVERVERKAKHEITRS